MTPLFYPLLALGLALATPLLALILAGVRRWQRRLSLTALIAAGAAGLIGGIGGLLAPEPATITLPLGLPWLPLHLRLDPLGGFFLAVVGGLTTFVGIYSLGYIRHLDPKRSRTPLLVGSGVFVFGMMGVCLADDMLAFMILWELMSVASYVLVAFEHEEKTNRDAAFLYLMIAHAGAIAILIAYGILATFGGGLTFAEMRASTPSAAWVGTAFVLALLGFGAKAGLAPLHVWLPEAHPAAPAPISALMSGAMLKIAIFGFLRLTLDLIGPGSVAPWWGGAVVALGSGSALTGALLAYQQSDLKRLLACSSIENVGIVFIGLGLCLIFSSYQLPTLAALALVAALYHSLNHALFKSLLFMGAGAVVHGTGRSNLEHLGGLIRFMPVTGFLFLVGAMAIAGLPPLNGFVSEWLTFQAALLSPQLPNHLLNALLPISAAMLALTGALSAAIMVKGFGIAFLGAPRSAAVHHAHEVGLWMRLGMALPALGCLLLGILPTWVIPALDTIPHTLLGHGIGAEAAQNGWLWLTPIAPERASYSGGAVALGLLLVGGIVWLALRRRGGAPKRVAIWDCGFPAVTSRMTITALGMSQMLRQVFSAFHDAPSELRLSDHGHRSLPTSMKAKVTIKDRVWEVLYQPIGAATLWLARYVVRLQTGKIHIYLTYSFVTVLFLMAVVSL